MDALKVKLILHLRKSKTHNFARLKVQTILSFFSLVDIFYVQSSKPFSLLLIRRNIWFFDWGRVLEKTVEVSVPMVEIEPSYVAWQILCFLQCRLYLTLRLLIVADRLIGSFFAVHLIIDVLWDLLCRIIVTSIFLSLLCMHVRHFF